MRFLLFCMAFIWAVCSVKGGTPETDFLWADVPDGVSLVKYIGSEEDIVIPETAGGKPVTEIGPWAFWNCLQAKKVKVGSRVTRIRQRAFWFCTELISLELPAGVSETGLAAFDECVQLQSFTLDPENQKYACRDGVLFSRDMKKLVRYPEGKRGSYIVPDGVRVIGEGAFHGCAFLEGVTLPEGLEEIEDRGFYSCCNLKELILPKSLKVIGNNAFTDCSRVEKLVIPAGVVRIGEDAFSWTNSLKGIWFEGDEPEAGGRQLGHFVPNYPVVYHRKDAKGWPGPGWRSMKTQIYEQE